MKRAILSVITVLALTGGAMAECADYLPPIDKMQEPTVPYDVTLVTNAHMNKLCGISGANRGACAVPDNMDFAHHTTVHWSIYLNDLSLTSDRQCNLLYEKAHLPPNNWFDPSVETHKLW